jgi:hypothetical protein
MKRFSTDHLAGWTNASDDETASLIDRVIADLERQALRCERATSNPERVADSYWRITDRH